MNPYQTLEEKKNLLKNDYDLFPPLSQMISIVLNEKKMISFEWSSEYEKEIANLYRRKQTPI